MTALKPAADVESPNSRDPITVKIGPRNSTELIMSTRVTRSSFVSGWTSIPWRRDSTVTAANRLK